MKRLFLILMACFLLACNDEMDVVLITDHFDYTAEFEQRGLTVSVFRTRAVKAELRGTALETTDQALALKYVDAINHMATGTVYLDLPQGYDAVFQALNKYEGRKFYCRHYHSVDIPEGCTLSYSAYNLLDSIAPVSRVDWQQAHPESVSLSSANIGYTVFVSDPAKLKLGAKLAAAHGDKLAVSEFPFSLDPDVYDLFAYYCEYQYARCESFDGYHLVRLRGEPDNDTEIGTLVVAWMNGVIE